MEEEEEEDTSKNCRGNSEAVPQVQLGKCLFRKHCVHYTRYKQQAHNKKKTWLFYHCGVIDVECDHLSHAGLEFPACFPFSVILKENLARRKGLVQLDNVLEQKS